MSDDKKNIKNYDAIIIGSGQSGNPLMDYLTERGQNVAMIERDKLGGSCVNYGCKPTKILIASSNLNHRVKESEALGVITENTHLDFQKVMKRKNDMVESSRQNVEKNTTSNEKVDLYRGIGSFVDKNTVNIKLNDGKEEEITGETIFINTGAKPNIIPLDGLDNIDYHDSTSIMELDELPEHLVILGTGYIALEFGQMFSRFGSKVTMIGRDEKMLEREDDDVSTRLQEILQDEGIDILLNTDTNRVEKNKDKVDVYIEKNGKEEKLTCSHFMLAVGRNPASKDLNLKNAGVEVDDRGNVKVDKKLKTTADNIYAIGDIKGGAQFTHISYDDYRIVINNMFGDSTRSTEDRYEPYTLYTQPQLGKIGLSEKEATEQGYDIAVSKIEMSKQGRLKGDNYTKGFIKAIVNKKDKKILGAAALSYQGGEIMAMIQIAMMGDLTYDRLRDGLFTHPSLSEMLNNLFDI